MNATSKENGLDTKNNKIPQKLVPPALAIFKNKSDWPTIPFLSPATKELPVDSYRTRTTFVVQTEIVEISQRQSNIKLRKQQAAINIASISS